jgi:TolA-binding protein
MRRVPSIPSAALRDHGGTERIDRIWKRIQPDLTGHGRALPRLSPSVWIPAALAAAFVLGIFVGGRARQDATPTATPERPVAPESAPRPAGTTERTITPSESPRAPQQRKNRAIGPQPPADLGFGVPTEVLPPVAQPAPAGPPEWEALADADKFAEARVALDQRGGFSAVLGSASATQLMTLADIARATGSREQAILALRRVVDSHPEAQVAPEAALTLGNLLEQAGDRAGALEAYALYRRLSPSGDFAEDALARQVDSALAQGNLEELIRLVAQYENDFPNGPRLEEFRSELAKRSAPGAATDPNAPITSPAGPAKDGAPEAPKPPSK